MAVEGLARGVSYATLADILQIQREDSEDLLLERRRFMEDVAKILLQHNNMIFNNEKALVYITINAMGNKTVYENLNKVAKN